MDIRAQHRTYSIIEDINKNIPLDHLSWRIDGRENNFDKVSDISIKMHKLGWYLRYYENSIQFLEKMNKIEKIIFLTNEDDREYWLFQFIMNELFNLNTNKYLMIYKKNKIDENIDEILSILIQIGEVTKDIVNSLDGTFMITKKYSKIIFEKLRTLIYKYRGFE